LLKIISIASVAPAAEGQAISLISHEEMDQLRGIQGLIKTDMDFALVAGF